MEKIYVLTDRYTGMATHVLPWPDYILKSRIEKIRKDRNKSIKELLHEYE